MSDQSTLPAEAALWGRADRWIEDLLADRLDDIVDRFSRHGIAAPEIVWQPALDALPAEPLRVLMRHWASLAAGPGAPQFGAIDPLLFKNALGYVNILEAIPGSTDCRYRLYGSIVASFSGFDMTGKRLSQHPASDYVVAFSLATTIACMRRGQPLLTQRQPAGAERTYRWPRLILPLADPDGSVSRVVVATVPLDAAGRMVD